MGNNQSTQRKDETGPSSFLACCTCPSQSRTGAETSNGSDPPESMPSEQALAQPQARSSMSMANSGRPASNGHALQHKPSMASTTPLRPPTRHRSDASKRGRPSTDSKRKGLRKTRQDQSTAHSTELMPLELPKLLPQQKRLSPLPDFASYLSSELGDLSQQPWVAVRTMAERLPSRRSSVLTAHENVMSGEYSQRLASVSGRSTPRSPVFRPASPALRSPLSVSENERTEMAAGLASPKASATLGLERPKSTPASALHPKVACEPLKEHLLPRPEPRKQQPPPIAYTRTLSDNNTDFDTKVLPGPVRSLSPHLTQRKPSVSNGFTILGRNTSLTAAHGKQDVEEDVRELQTFVEAKREIIKRPAQLHRSDSAAQRLEDAEKHRPAIAPGMLIGGSSALLGDIGSAFSRSTSETPMTVQHRDELQRTPSNSHPPSSFPRRLPKWIQGYNPEEGSPRHSGTFFVGGRLSRNSSTNGSNEQRPSIDKPVSLASKRDESPVDKHWTPPESDRPTAATPTKDRSNRPAVPEKDTVKPAGQQPPLVTRHKRSSTVGVSNPTSDFSVITGSAMTSPVDSKSRSGRSFGTTLTTDSQLTPARASSRSRSRTDKSAAVQAARTRALTRTQSHEAMVGAGLGLGIGGLGRAKDDMILNIVDIDKMQPQPRSSSLRKKHDKPDRSSSTIANPSDSPMDTSGASPAPRMRHIAAQQVARAIVVPASRPETEGNDRPRVLVRQSSVAKQSQQQKEKALAGPGVNIVRPPRSSSNAKPAVTDVTQPETTTPVLVKPRPVAIDDITVTTPPPPPPPPYETRPKLDHPGTPSGAIPAIAMPETAKPTGYRSRTNSRSQSVSHQVPSLPSGPTPPPVPRKAGPAQLPGQDTTRGQPAQAHAHTKSQTDNPQVKRRPLHSRTKSTPHTSKALAAAKMDTVPLPPTGDSTKLEAEAGEQQLRGRALSQTKRGRTRTPTRRQRSQPARVTSMSPEEKQSRERETRKRDFEMDVKRSASARRLREVEAELRRVEGELANLGFGIGGGKTGEGGAGVGVAF